MFLVAVVLHFLILYFLPFDSIQNEIVAFLILKKLTKKKKQKKVGKVKGRRRKFENDKYKKKKNFDNPTRYIIVEYERLSFTKEQEQKKSLSTKHNR